MIVIEMPVTTRKKKTTLENNVDNFQKKSKIVNVAKQRNHQYLHVLDVIWKFEQT